MSSVKQKFENRKNRTRSSIAKLSTRHRLTVFKSGQHVYAQVIDDKNSNTVTAASTLDATIKKLDKSNCNIDSAIKVGKLIGERAKEKGITQVVFDKGGYKYHGVVKALADAARENLEF
jgi:large subunit ribosomal protein L18